MKKGKRNKWQEEFESEGIHFIEIYEKYIGIYDERIIMDKVKVKCKDGLIQIERID